VKFVQIVINFVQVVGSDIYTSSCKWNLWS